MNAKELTDEIHHRLMVLGEHRSEIEPILTAALEEAYRKGFEELQSHRFESIAQAKAAAYVEGYTAGEKSWGCCNQAKKEAYEDCAITCEDQVNIHSKQIDDYESGLFHMAQLLGAFFRAKASEITK